MAELIHDPCSKQFFYCCALCCDCIPRLQHQLSAGSPVQGHSNYDINRDILRANCFKLPSRKAYNLNHGTGRNITFGWRTWRQPCQSYAGWNDRDLHTASFYLRQGSDGLYYSHDPANTGRDRGASSHKVSRGYRWRLYGLRSSTNTIGAFISSIRSQHARSRPDAAGDQRSRCLRARMLRLQPGIGTFSAARDFRNKHKRRNSDAFKRPSRLIRGGLLKLWHANSKRCHCKRQSAASIFSRIVGRSCWIGLVGSAGQILRLLHTLYSTFRCLFSHWLVGIPDN